MFKNKKIFILGMARSGYEVAKLLSKDNNQILITDMKEQDPKQVEELKGLGVNYIVTDSPEEMLDDSYDYVVKNPGIISTHKCVVKAKKLGIEVINEVEVAYHYLPKGVKIVGITGSNGKTTTTTITYEILKAAKLPVHLGGNIGIPLSKLVTDIKPNDILVIEVSSHQLVDFRDFKTDISVVTNLSPIHLDFFGTYENYINNKARIFNHHTKDDLVILNHENNDVLKISENIPSQKLYFSSKNRHDAYIEKGYICYQGDPIVETTDIRVKGMHNYENIMCAIMVAKYFDVENNIIKEVLNKFAGVEHRIEFVKRLNGREFYNDSKATNVESTIIALNSFDKPTIILLGGLDRGHSFDDLEPHMKNVKGIVCYGETKNRIREWSHKINIDSVVVNTLEEAVKAAYNLSDENDVILLSPACASWDQYKSFEERGDEFKKFINNLE
ncbi:MAG: UDP-N-acetylmuramoyl-L-alanine--D-glutamate ligase [Bacilli bacterium]|nr:UDP-N-acetylmuramoyl-L-alanine--D-glutamate ligase [Bacilli bacterium]MDD4809498.1 UDP-N-acetylmuramoyl-L-alanine--D-glutamate ligase [Bacilli bacterium]